MMHGQKNIKYGMMLDVSIGIHLYYVYEYMIECIRI